MTQYPPNYQPPPYGYQGYQYQKPPDPLAPAKRASILMFILGGLSLCCGLCTGIFAVLPWEQMAGSNPDVATVLNQFKEMGVAPNVLFGIFAVMTLIPGILYVILGFFVRRGSMSAAITSIVVTSLAILLLLSTVVTSVVHLGAHRASRAEDNPCVAIVGLALLVLLLAWLIQAVKGISQHASSAAQYQQQYWQYQQQYNQQPAPPQTPPPIPQMPPPSTLDAPPKDPKNPT